MSNIQDAGQTETANTTPAVQIIAIWAIALLPMAWGFINTLMRAAKLFQ